MKKVLAVYPRFYGYGEVITKTLRDDGYEVTPFYVSGASAFRDPLKKYRNNLKLKRERDELYTLLDNNSFDYFLVIKGLVIEPKHIQLFKEKNKNGISINFQWDSFGNIGRGLKSHGLSVEFYLSLYDRIFTFDLENYESKSVKNLQFRPLFYSFIHTSEVKKDSYDMGTISGMTPFRFMMIDALKKAFPHLRYRVLFYSGIDKYTLLYFLKFRYKFLQYCLLKKMPYQETLAEMSSMKAVVDVPNYHQSGLTMRTFEALELGCKLITTNQSIEKYDFYHPNNIFILNEALSNISEIEEFLSLPFIPIDPVIWKKYHVSSFVKALVEDQKYVYVRKNV